MAFERYLYYAAGISLLGRESRPLWHALIRYLGLLLFLLRAWLRAILCLVSLVTTSTYSRHPPIINIFNKLVPFNSRLGVEDTISCF